MELLNVVRSTAAAFFLGTPHRGSKGIAGAGEIVRKASSAVLMSTNTAMLDALGVKNSDLECCQELYSCLWQRFDFRVKTFQESLPVASVSVGLLREG